MTAELIATQAHDGQFRFDGVTPYIVHPRAVVARLIKMGVKNKDILDAAWGHDLLEDTKETPDSLRAKGFSERSIFIIQLLTKKPGVSEEEYNRKIKENKGARQIKIADMLSNMADTPSKNQILRYSRGLIYFLS